MVRRSIIFLLLLFVASPIILPNSYVQAAASMRVSKQIYNTPTDFNGQNAVRGAALTSIYKNDTSTQYKVVIAIDNLTSASQTISVNDPYTDSTSGFQNATADGWYTFGETIKLAANTCSNGVCQGSYVISPGGHLEMRYTVSAPLLPTVKTRLVAFPVSVTSLGLASAVYDVAYVLFAPPSDQTDNTTASVFSTTVGAKPNPDLGILVPGTLVSGDSKFSTAGSLVVIPRQGGDTAFSTRVCYGQTQTNNRGGSCLLSSPVVVSDGTVTSTVDARLLVLPSSSIIGNVYVGAASNAARIILPGEHTVTGNVSNRSAQSSLSYSINQNSVGGWNAARVASNVYLDANISRLKRTPDITLTKDNYTILKPIIDAGGVFTLNCSGACTQGANGASTFTLVVANGVVAKLDLSSPNLTGSGTGPQKTTTNGSVLYVAGTLNITGTQSGQNLGIIQNMAKGTIVADNSINLTSITMPANITQSPPLAFIALGNVAWTLVSPAVPAPRMSYLQSVAFFAKGSFSANNSSGKTNQMKLIGSVVANTVDLSSVVANSDADKLNMEIIYDQVLADSPPPGTSVFSGSPVLQDKTGQ